MSTLPTDDLKRYGILQEDETFSRKLTPDNISKFLNGYILVADNENKRATFQLVDNLSRLQVKIFERDKAINQLLDKSRQQIMYTNSSELSDTQKPISFSKSAYLYDPATGNVREFDLILQAKELTREILKNESREEQGRYREELEKMRNFLMDKLDEYPEIAKDIQQNINVLDGELGVMTALSQSKTVSTNTEKDLKLDVADPDMFEDANHNREQTKEEQNTSRGFKR